jgi:transcriptional regulator with XRE-family HTH domain
MAGHKDTSAATHFGRQMKKERLAHGWSLQELSLRTAYDGAHLSRIENGLRPPTRALALACDVAFPERRGWFTDYYDESRQWAEVPPGFRDWSEIEDKAVQLRAWTPGIIHGLLQTEDYAAALLRTSPGASDETVAGRLRARMERQRRIILREILPPPASSSMRWRFTASSAPLPS